MSGEINAEIDAIFPQLSSILHLDAKTMEKMLKHCDLCKEYGSITTPYEHKFNLFIAEYKLNIQFTHFKINNKRLFLLKIGDFDRPKMPMEYWRNRKEKAFAPPNIRIYRLSRELASSVVRMGLPMDDDVSDEDRYDGDASVQSDNYNFNDLDNNSDDGAINQLDEDGLKVPSTVNGLESTSNGMFF